MPSLTMRRCVPLRHIHAFFITPRTPVTASVGVYQDGRRLIVSAVPLEERGYSGGAPKIAVDWQQLCSSCQGR